MLAHMKNNIALTAEQRLRGSRVLQALANPLRLEIMQALTESSLTCSELQTLLGCPQSTVVTVAEPMKVGSVEYW